MKHNRKALLLLMMLCLLLPAPGGLAQPAAMHTSLPVEAGLARLPLDLQEPVLLMAVAGSRMVLLSHRGEEQARHLHLYDFPAMTPLAHAVLEARWQLDYLAFDHLGFLQDGRIYVLSLYTGTLLVFDADLGSREEVVFGPEAAFHSALVQGDGEVIWAADHEGQITGFQVASGQGRQVVPQLPPGWQLDHFLASEKGRLRSRYDQEGLSVVVEMDLDGRSNITPVLPGVTWLSGHQALFSGRSLALLYTPGQQEMLELAAWELWESPLSLAADALFTIHYQGEQVVLKRYDLNRRLLGNRLEVPQVLGDLLFSQALPIGDGRVLLLYQGLETVNQALYLWDSLAAPQNADTGIRATTSKAFAGDNDALAREIGQRHGLQLRLRQAGAGFFNEVYVAQPSLEELHIREAMLDVDAFFNSLPRGMLQEALLPPVTEFAIYLAGRIQQKGQEGIMSAAAFSAQEGNRRFIVLDIREGGLMRLMAHEFMHVLEDRLEQAAGNSPWPLLWSWQRLGPREDPDYGFHFRYTDEEGYTLWDTAYTAADFDAAEHPEDIWFIDAYSRTLPIEDRARLFETMLMPSTHEDPFVYPQIQRKARALSALLREAFPTVAALVQAPWEAVLEQPGDEALIKSLYEELQAIK